uniref:Uncharacterized protein n=1 Tax=viral metagenome TaxID=1070528 RepID=A0A6C0J1X0_9ZZZZ
MDEERFDKFSGLFSQACEKYRINDKEVATSPTRSPTFTVADGNDEATQHSGRPSGTPGPAVRSKYIQESRPEKVCCLNLHGDMNIGQIVRTAEIFGMSEVLIVWRKKYDRRITVGVEFRIPVTKHWTAKGIIARSSIF